MLHETQQLPFPVEKLSNFGLSAGFSERLYYSWSRIRPTTDMPTAANFSDYNRVMTISNVQLAHAGTYRCTVFRQLGQQTSGDLTIAVEGNL